MLHKCSYFSCLLDQELQSMKITKSEHYEQEESTALPMHMLNKQDL